MFVFYDTETTGISKDFTQILQIGMLFTDDDLNILSSKKLDCRNAPWTLPAPAALLTTGFTPDDLKTNKNTNYEMMQDANDWLRGQHWPITFVGYNSITYDEPVLAQNFYQSLLPTNLTTDKSPENGQFNGRADVMYMVEAAALYMPGALKLDTKNYYGLPSMTLKAVAQQNGVNLSDEDAHDALNDIKATVGVAKVVKKAAPQVWDQMMSLSTTQGVEEFLGKNKIFTYANANHYDEVEKKPYAMQASVMTALTGVEGTAGQTLFDLRVDPTPYLKMSVEQLKDVFLSQDRSKPLVLMDKGSQPILMPMDLSDKILTKTDDAAVFEARAKTVKAHKAFLENVAKAAALATQEEQQPAVPATTAFPETMVDKHISVHAKTKLDAWAKEFREADDWHARAVMVEGFRSRFKDELEKDPSLDRFVKIAGRLVYEHAPQELTAQQQESMKKFIAARILNPDPNAPYMTIAKARKELSTVEWLRKKPDSDKWKDVTDTDIRRLKLYYTSLEKEYAPYAPHLTKPANNNAPALPPVKKPSTGFNGKSPKP